MVLKNKQHGGESWVCLVRWSDLVGCRIKEQPLARERILYVRRGLKSHYRDEMTWLHTLKVSSRYLYMCVCVREREKIRDGKNKKKTPKGCWKILVTEKKSSAYFSKPHYKAHLANTGWEQLLSTASILPCKDSKRWKKYSSKIACHMVHYQAIM